MMVYVCIMTTSILYRCVQAILHTKVFTFAHTYTAALSTHIHTYVPSGMAALAISIPANRLSTTASSLIFQCTKTLDRTQSRTVNFVTTDLSTAVILPCTLHGLFIIHMMSKVPNYSVTYHPIITWIAIFSQ